MKRNIINTDLTLQYFLFQRRIMKLAKICLCYIRLMEHIFLALDKRYFI
jgi:hypothetical protein